MLTNCSRAVSPEGGITAGAFPRGATAPDRQVGPLLLAAWFGLVTGQLEIWLLAVKKLCFGEYILVSPQVVWMAPLADLAFFGAMGATLLLASRLIRGLSVRATSSILSFWAFLGLLPMITSLQQYAVVILAAGFAVQTGRLCSNHVKALRSVIRPGIALTAGLVLMMAAGVNGWQAFTEQRRLGQLPPARADAPNVLLITLDTVRAESLSLYGRDRPTSPRLEQLARNGVRFEWAITTAPWTLPSHASMFTGRYPHEMSADWGVALDDTSPTLSEVLSDNGYVTAGFVANTLYGSYEHGLDRGFLHYEDYRISLGEIMLSSSLVRNIANSRFVRRATGYRDVLGRKTAEQLNEDFLEWLSYSPRRPFFAFLNYFDAHEPYLPPEPYKAMFAQGTPRKTEFFRHWMREGWRSNKEDMSQDEIQAEVDAYEASIAYLDNQLGLLLDELHKRSLLEDTLLIITSDHGEQFGEHGRFTHGNSLYLQCLRVPLVLLFPSRVPANISVREPVTLRDIPATVIDLVGLENEGRLPGISLGRLWNGNPPAASLLLSELTPDPGLPASDPASKGETKSLIIDNYHYIVSGDGREEVYDIAVDAVEATDLAGAEKGRQVLGRFRAALDQVRRIARGNSISGGVPNSGSSNAFWGSSKERSQKFQ